MSHGYRDGGGDGLISETKSSLNFVMYHYRAMKVALGNERYIHAFYNCESHLSNIPQSV